MIVSKRQEEIFHNKEDFYNLPNLVSLIRILMAPVLIYLALTQQPDWYIGMLVFTVFTDVLDGFLARVLNQITKLGSHLDSWGDFVIYNTMALCAWILSAGSRSRCRAGFTW